MADQEKMYGIVVVRPGDDRRLFGRVRRSSKGDVYVVWAEDESASNLAKGSNLHASYHVNGRLHSKTYDQVSFWRNPTRHCIDWRHGSSISSIHTAG